MLMRIILTSFSFRPILPHTIKYRSMELIKKRDYIEKRAAYVKKLSDNYQTSLLFTNFRKEIETTTNAEIEATEEIGKLLETINNLIQQDEDDDNMNMLKFIFILDLDQFAHLIHMYCNCV